MRRKLMVLGAGALAISQLFGINMATVVILAAEIPLFFYNVVTDLSEN